MSSSDLEAFLWSEAGSWVRLPGEEEASGDEQREGQASQVSGVWP